MDPNRNLDEQLALAKQIVDMCERADRPIELEAAATRLAELVEGLDHWLTGGGFLPSRWAVRGK